MCEEKYGLHSVFDAEKHKQTFVHYLEVVVDAEGGVSYAVPSHQECMIAGACKSLGVSRGELYALCPKEYYWDFMKWLSGVSGLMAVWENHCEAYMPTVKQIATLRRLKMAGLYTGIIPHLEKEHEQEIHTLRSQVL